jgi:ATP-dependent protease HslVU (ClpYQ) peptidase subunit
MACDSAHTSNDVVISKQTKIRKTAGGCLFGCAGIGDDRDLVARLDPVERPEQLPSTEELIEGYAHLDGLLVFPDGRMFLVCARRESAAEEAGVQEIVGFDGYAIGSGGDIARGAMMAGLSASQAVWVAIQLDTCSGEPIHCLASDNFTVDAPCQAR